MTQNTERRQGYIKRGKRRNDKGGLADEEGWKLYYTINSRIFCGNLYFAIQKKSIWLDGVACLMSQQAKRSFWGFLHKIVTTIAYTNILFS